MCIRDSIYTISRLYDPNNFYYCRSRCPRFEDYNSLYDPNNFYYCRYKQELIDIKGLYDPNNFYYCRYERTTTSAMSVYMTQTISTIVDFVNYARRINSLQGIVQIILTLLSCFGVKLLNFV